jgi:hypothetical protein
MSTLGVLWSQQLGFTITTTAGTVYTHALGYTPTVVILTLFGAVTTPSIALSYTAAGTNLITICNSGPVCNADVTVGSFHSIIK